VSRDYVLHPAAPAAELRIDYAAELNPQQFAAATAPPGPALVIAGAGSGKTRTLTYRVAYLLERGVPPDRILLLTFTNKAAREMMRRVAELAGGEADRVWGGTFHSIGARLLRVNAAALGFRPDYTILDREDAEDLLKACLADAEIDPKKARFPKAEVLADIYSRAVNDRRPVPEIVERDHAQFEDLAEDIARIGAAYTRRKQAANVMDFDDLLALWLRLLEEHAEARERYQRRFQWILVDEFQDTNRIQGDLIDLLAAQHRNVMAVGDDAQSIYSWRGADFRNILEFPQRHPDARVFKIEVNYRSTPEVLAVANAVIRGNAHQFPKELAAARRPGLKPALIPCEDGHQQAAFVAQRMLELHEEGVPLRELAVLYRSHFHALELQLELTRRGIPFLITSGIRFFEQAHIKDVAAALKLLANPADELAFKRVACLLPGIGGKGAEKVWRTFSARTPGHEQQTTNNEPLTDEAPSSKLQASTSVGAVLMGCSSAVPKKAAVAWAQLATTLAQLEAPDLRDQPGRQIRLFLEAFYSDYAEETFANARQRLDDLDELTTYAAQFTTLTDFLTQLSLLNNLEAEDDKKPAADDDRVRLTTVHQAKGLEYAVVFVIMLCDGLFPGARSLDSPERLEEERRLFYVAVTRAKDELYLSHPLLRSTPGAGTVLLQRSRFLDELPAELLDEWNLRPHAWDVPPAKQPDGDEIPEGEQPF